MSPSSQEQAKPHGHHPNTGFDDSDYAEFEVGHHKVPWFLWVFFLLIVTWASVSWIPFFGY